MTEQAAAEPAGPNPTDFRLRWPFFWVNRTNIYYERALERRMKRFGCDMPRWRVLMSLHERDFMSVSEISAFSTLKLNTTTKIVQRMIADGLVETRVRPTDGRVTEVTLTAKGEAMREKALVEAHAVRSASFEGVSPEDIARLNALLSEVCDRLDRL